MNLDQLATPGGGWLSATGPDSDTVVSPRIRLARNLATFPSRRRTSPPPKLHTE